MPMERRYLLNREVQAIDSAVRRVELARQGLVSAIMLRFECTNGATSGTERIADAIDRVEVVADGSDILFSLTGVELDKWQQVWSRRPAAQLLTMVAAAVQELNLLVPFGRFIGDPEAYLDLSQYQRVELVITHSPTIAATSFATATFTVTAIEYSWRAGMVPGARLGWLRTRQVRDFTSAASGEEEIELDRRHPLVGALVYAREAAIADGVDITIVEVQEDGGRLIPLTGRFLDWQMENQVMLNLHSEEVGVALLTDAETVDTWVSRIQSASVHLREDTAGADAAHPLARIATITADRLAMSVVEADEAGTQADSAVATALYELHWRARGIGIGNAVWVPFAMPGDLRNPYPAPVKDRVDLVLTNGGAGATVRVSTQELVAA